MKKLALIALILAGAALTAPADDLVILTTNDTHSNIDSDPSGFGGILPRKAIVDSVRKAEKNVVLVDAGDIVQGTLYFKYFGGDVEYPLFNMMNYDIRILGNHEFDNGLDELAKHWKTVKGARLSANYDFNDTPAKGLFDPYVIKKIGKRKVGFIGINIDPESLISKENYTGMKYRDAIEVANETAEYLKNSKHCDLVVAVTHIGYNEDEKVSDIALAKNSKDIDIIIGGHSHTYVDPSKPDVNPHWFTNSLGKPVLVTQTGKYGYNVGYIKIDLDKLDSHNYKYDYIPVTDRFDSKSYDPKLQAFIAPYKHIVDSVNNNVIGYSQTEVPNARRTGAYPNWASDMALDIAIDVVKQSEDSDNPLPEIDFAMMNVGGIRQPMPAGDITEGLILSTFPFSNKLNIVSIKGKDIIDALRIAAAKGGEGVSRNVLVVTDADKKLETVLINSKPVDPEKTYTLATIDYLAQGNDGLRSLGNNKLLWESKEILSEAVLDYIKNLTANGVAINPDTRSRFVVNQNK